MDYYQKYLKYKQKYLKLKQIGGVNRLVTEEELQFICRWAEIIKHELNFSDITYAELSRYRYVFNKKRKTQRRFSSIPQPIPDSVQISAEKIAEGKVKQMVNMFNTHPETKPNPTPTPFNLDWVHYENNCSGDFFNFAARLTLFLKRGDKITALSLIENCLRARAIAMLDVINTHNMLIDTNHLDIIYWMNELHNRLVSIPEENIINYCAEYDEPNNIVSIIEG
jgi:hypothetical protein